MSPVEQLFNTNLDHFGPGNCTNPPPEQDLECGQSTVHGYAREYAQAYGQHQELCGVSRHTSQGESALYPLFR
jgi:hypothetical protein